MALTRLRNPAEIREAQLRQGAAFRTSWERTALALIGYRVKHHLTQT